MKSPEQYKSPKGYTSQAMKDAKIRLAFRKRKVSEIKAIKDGKS